MSKTTQKIGNLRAPQGFYVFSKGPVYSDRLSPLLPADLRHCLGLLPEWWCRTHPNQSSQGVIAIKTQKLELFTLADADPFAVFMTKLCLANYCN